MATLVSPGTVVPITDESFYVPVSAPTVPLIFIATVENKYQADGIQIAPGTTESSVVRTVTSLAQSAQLFGIPSFQVAPGDEVLPVAQRSQLHGDARNEYGVATLNHFLNIGNRAYVVRADIDLGDDETISLAQTAPVYTGVGDGIIVDALSAIGIDVDPVNGVEETWTITAITSTDFSVVGSVSGAQGTAVVNTLYDNGVVSFTIEPGSIPFNIGDRFTVSLVEQVTGTGSLGNNDTERRGNIAAALAAEINTNSEVRSERYEYNLILAPGFPEVVDELQSLAQSINDEAFILGSSPMDMNVEEIVSWSQSTDRKNGNGLAYYYPHGLVSNLDGSEVVIPAEAIALRTITYSDQVGDIWQAAAGAQRGLVTGVGNIGYVSGTLGEPTTFVETTLNNGQRDALYETGKNINPIAFFPGRGFLVFGQKTSSPASSALDRINVMRMMMMIKRSLRKGSFPFLFEINDQITRDNLKAMIDGFLGDILIRRGIYDFATVCDESNNTPTRIDRNELWCDVAIKPAKTAEFIYIPIRVVNTGDDI